MNRSPARTNEFCADYLRELVHYDPDTGDFTWRNRADRSSQWNGRYAGKIAGARSLSHNRHSIRVDGRCYYAHRLAWLYMTGVWPSGEIDHHDCNPSNNKWANLRHATSSQNNANTRTPRHNTSGYKGVSWVKTHNLWKAQIAVGRRTIFIGYYRTAEAGHAAYRAAAAEYYGEFGRTA